MSGEPFKEGVWGRRVSVSPGSPLAPQRGVGVLVRTEVLEVTPRPSSTSEPQLGTQPFQGADGWDFGGRQRFWGRNSPRLGWRDWSVVGRDSRPLRKTLSLSVRRGVPPCVCLLQT